MYIEVKNVQTIIIDYHSFFGIRKPDEKGDYFLVNFLKASKLSIGKDYI